MLIVLPGYDTSFAIIARGRFCLVMYPIASGSSGPRYGRKIGIVATSGRPAE